MQKIPSCVLNLKLLRTFLMPEQSYDGSNFSRSICHQLASRCRRLRVLDLHDLGVKTLPSSIGKLIHLRYLNLSRTPLRALPDSITELRNLQTIDLHECYSLKRLPADFRKLTNHRSLNVSETPRLTYMPSGIGVLTSLHKLTNLTVSQRNPPALGCKHAAAKLSDLKNLDNLRGVLQIKILGELKEAVFEAKEANLNSKHGLIELHIESGKLSYGKATGIKQDEAVLEGLKPHPNLKKLEIYWYRGQKLASWAVMNNLCTSLPNLVEIELLRCGNCQQLPSFGQLPFLKRLGLISLQSVEYMESSQCYISQSPEPIIFFPSLEELTLMSMDNLKGWWQEVRAVDRDDQTELSVPILKQHHLLGKSFLNLSKLMIDTCPNLTSIPLCPNVEELTLLDINEHLSTMKMAASLSSEISAATTSSLSCGSSSKLKTLSIDSVEDLISLPEECLHHLSSLNIQDPKLQSTSRLGEPFRSLSSLRSLDFTFCHGLRSFSRGFEHLTALEKMAVWCCDELDLLSNEDVENGMPWKAFNNLQSLKFHIVNKLVALPSGLQHLKNLRSLVISSLNELQIIDCPGLTKRCRGPTGKDWPKIRHIPDVSVRKSVWD